MLVHTMEEEDSASPTVCQVSICWILETVSFPILVHPKGPLNWGLLPTEVGPDYIVTRSVDLSTAK